MKLSIFILATLCYLSVCARGVLPKLSPDSSYVTILVNGKPMVIPRIVSENDLPFPTISPLVEKQMLFATDKPFVQNDTTFLYREYSYYQCDTCTQYQLDSSSYFVRPKTWEGYLQHLRDYTWWKQEDESSKEYFDEAYKYLYKRCPVLPHNQLGDAPRLWYPVVKYRGKYYISIDDLTAVELTDSLVIYHDMEVNLSALLSFGKADNDSYIWQEVPEYDEGLASVTIRPANGVKGLYVMATTRRKNGKVTYRLVTPESDIHHFDFIDWRSSDHIPDGLEYDAVDFESL